MAWIWFGEVYKYVSIRLKSPFGVKIYYLVFRYVYIQWLYANVCCNSNLTNYQNAIFNITNCFNTYFEIDKTKVEKYFIQSWYFNLFLKCQYCQSNKKL